MDEELKRYLDERFAAVDARFDALLARMNNQHERLIDRTNALDTEIRNLRFEHETGRRLTFELPGTLLKALEAGFIARMTDLEARVKKLEDDSGKPKS